MRFVDSQFAKLFGVYVVVLSHDEQKRQLNEKTGKFMKKQAKKGVFRHFLENVDH